MAESAMNTVQKNDDLNWDLKAISDKSQAIRFVSGLEKYFCVYSGLVEQLYSNYKIFAPEDDTRNLVILPDPYAFHDTFFNISQAAVAKTGLHLISGEVINQKGLFFVGMVRNKFKFIRFQTGLEKILKKSPASDPFLPVLLKGDLKQVKEQMPCLHLHKIHISKLKGHSDFDRGEVKRVITNMLISLYRKF